MARKKITSKLTPLTKRQESVVKWLGAEWAALDTEENHIIKLIRDQYEKLEPGANTAAELKKLESRQKEISESKNQISAQLIALEEKAPRSRRRGGGTQGNPVIRIRNLFIREHGNQTGLEICRELDDLVMRDGMPIGFPVRWVSKCGVTSYENVRTMSQISAGSD